MKKIELKTALRRLLTDAKTKHIITDAMGWDDSNVSRFLSGQSGVTIEKLDQLIEAVGFIPVQRDYFDAMRTFSIVGNNCECAISGMGACGLSAL